MATIPENPTWQELQQGLTGSGRAKRLALDQVNDAETIINDEEIKLKVAKQNVARADADLGQWLAAVKRKVDSLA